MTALNASKLFIIFFICCSAWIAQARLHDCCLKVSDKEVDQKSVADYSTQIRGQGCAIDALIFVTRRQRTLCLPVDSPQAGPLKKHVDFLKKLCSTNGHRNRCFGVNVR